MVCLQEIKSNQGEKCRGCTCAGSYTLDLILFSSTTAASSTDGPIDFISTDGQIDFISTDEPAPPIPQDSLKLSTSAEPSKCVFH